MLEFGEMLNTGDTNVLYKWNILNDSFGQINEMTRLLETLTLYGGLTRKDMVENLAEKSAILDWMLRNNITGIDDSGFVVANYYKHKDKVIGLVKDNVAYSKDIF